MEARPVPVYRLGDQLVFPPPYLASEEGLLAVGGDLRPERLLLAYRNAIFPWYNDGDPILWWSPDPRVILPLDGLHVSRSLQKVLRQGRFEVRFDTDFPGVIDACATIERRAQRGTWITTEMRDAYIRLHELGYAHCAECRQGGELVGGIYGVALGGCFFGESMFSRVSNASKVALVTLVERLRRMGYSLFDCQVANPHLLSLGAQEISRARFLRRLEGALSVKTVPGPWCAQV
jgi:leucyl/phenylalanyl-tRNA--protein transferase